MRRSRGLLVVSVLSAAALVARADEPTARPKVAVDREVQDWGVVKQRTDLTTEFTVKNEGDAPLRLKGAWGDCGCVMSKIEANEVAPGAATTLAVTLRTETLSGKVSKRVRVDVDDPDRPLLLFRLVCDVAAGIVQESKILAFSPALVGTSPTASVVLKWKEGVGKPFRVVKVEPNGVPGATFSTKPWEGTGWRGHTVVLSFSKPPPVGMLSGRAIVHTDDPETPKIELLVGGIVSGKVFLVQREVSVGIVPQGRGAKIPVPLRGFDATVDLGEVGASSRKGRVVATAKRDPVDARSWVVEVRLPEDAPEGAVEDVVDITTAVPGEEKVELKVTGYVSAKPGR